MSKRLRDSITVDSNPEGINQYTGGGGGGKETASSATKAVTELSKSADAATAAAKGARGAERIALHQKAMELHKKAEAENDRVAMMHSRENNIPAATNHSRYAQYHQISARQHSRKLK